MSNKKPQPLFDQTPRSCCPVCGEISYSAAGIHPQCAVRRADHDRAQQRVRGRAKTPAAVNDLSPWKRVCPACGVQQHIRKKVCVCSHVFALHPRPPTSEDAPS